MQQQSIGINLFNIIVRHDVTVSPRQEDLSRDLHSVPDSDHHSGTKSGCESLSPENVIFTIGVQMGDSDSLVARDPMKLLFQKKYVSERKASYRSWGFRMCAMNGALDKGRSKVKRKIRTSC